MDAESKLETLTEQYTDWIRAMRVGQRKTIFTLNGLRLHEAAEAARVDIVVTRNGTSSRGWPMFEVLCVGRY